MANRQLPHHGKTRVIVAVCWSSTPQAFQHPRSLSANSSFGLLLVSISYPLTLLTPYGAGYRGYCQAIPIFTTWLCAFHQLPLSRYKVPFISTLFRVIPLVGFLCIVLVGVIPNRDSRVPRLANLRACALQPNRHVITRALQHLAVRG